MWTSSVRCFCTRRAHLQKASAAAARSCLAVRLCCRSLLEKVRSVTVVRPSSKTSRKRDQLMQILPLAFAAKGIMSACSRARSPPCPSAERASTCAENSYEDIARPKQSWQVCGLSDVEVDEERPVLVAARLRGVMRVDEAETYCVEDALDRGGQGCILMERLIHEIAYKVARAPKFGS